MVLILPLLIVITLLLSIMAFNVGLPIWIPIVFTAILIAILAFSIYMAFKNGKNKPIIIYVVILFVLLVLTVIFKQQIMDFVNSIMLPIGPGGLPLEN